MTNGAVASAATEVNSLNQLGRLRARIKETAHNKDARPVVIVALGDSVTAGENATDVYHAQLNTLLEDRFPLSRFRIVNAGVGGECAFAGHRRLEKDVIALHPDLVIIAFGLNDADGGHLEGLPFFESDMQKLVRGTRNATVSDIMLLTPNMMLTRQNDQIPAESAHMTERFLHLQKDGVLAAYAQQIAKVAAAERVALGDVYQRWAQIAAAGVDTTAMLVNGLNHPDARGGRLSAEVILKVIDPAFEVAS